ncbi:MAG TPA: hydrogenase small subunit [Vicinamibacteria bacterium]|nr:hydrogenase small subunit [Vicinamibacteria bacterium]
MEQAEGWFLQELEARGVSRREFMGFCSAMAAALALPRTAVARIAAEIEKTEKPVLVWLEFQDCCGNSESFLRASRPTAAEIVLDTLSVDYHETIMAAAGRQAEENLARTIKERAGKYLVVVEGSIPTGANGAYCMIGGRSALDIVREACAGAAATIAMGTCATFGGLPAAAPNPTGALGVADAVPGVKNLINLSACPANAENLTALIVYFLTFKHWPPLDAWRRPLFAYGKSIHDNCERRAHFDAGQYVEAWGDEPHRTGYCLYKMGCKGPVTFQNCPNVRWNEGTSWPIGCGHPCIGCAEPDFWDKMTPFYQHLPNVPGFGLGATVDRVGLWATVGVGAAFAAHGFMSLAQRWWRAEHHPAARERAEEARRREEDAGGGPEQKGGPS